jgi:hypothetical protein
VEHKHILDARYRHDLPPVANHANEPNVNDVNDERHQQLRTMATSPDLITIIKPSSRLIVGECGEIMCPVEEECQVSPKTWTWQEGFWPSLAQRINVTHSVALSSVCTTNSKFPFLLHCK